MSFTLGLQSDIQNILAVYTSLPVSALELSNELPLLFVDIEVDAALRNHLKHTDRGRLLPFIKTNK